MFNFFAILIRFSSKVNVTLINAKVLLPMWNILMVLKISYIFISKILYITLKNPMKLSDKHNVPSCAEWDILKPIDYILHHSYEWKVQSCVLDM